MNLTLFQRDPFTRSTMAKHEKIIVGTPPVWDSVCQWLGFLPMSALFTYGDTIYNPGSNPIPDQLIVHEQVHMVQQYRERAASNNPRLEPMNPALWWGKFLRDKDFRYQEESEAYGAQYAWLCKQVKGTEQHLEILMQLSRILAGPLYGSELGFQDAMRMIKSKSLQ